jgi:hypothetical protein
MSDRATRESQETLGQARRAGSLHGKRRSVRKIEPLPGTLRAELVRCGKRACRCARGQRHGPYLYHRWREQGLQRRRYVRPADADRVCAGLAEWRRLHPPARSARELLREMRRETRRLFRLLDLAGL